MNYQTCLWCGRGLRRAEAIQGNLCPECQQISVGISELSVEQLDALPFGVIQLNKNGTIQAFNTTEEEMSGRLRENVIGKNFFAEVAPCSEVRGFRRRFEEFLNGSQPSEIFDYTYYFEPRAVKVQLTFLRVNQQLAFVLSKRVEK